MSLNGGMTLDTACISPISALDSFIDTSAIAVHFQPIVSVHSGHVFAYEALSRGPAGTALEPPLALFRAAREHRLLAPLEAVCRERAMTRWVDAGLDERLFINVSPEVLLCLLYTSPSPRD